MFLLIVLLKYCLVSISNVYKVAKNNKIYYKEEAKPDPNTNSNSNLFHSSSASNLPMTW